MTAIRVTGFRGILPRTANRLLPDQAAQLAQNVILSSGELRALNAPAFVYAPSSALAVQSVFRVDDSTWFCWPTADVAMVKVPLASDARYAYTGDGVPKITTKTLGTPVSVSGVPAACRALGIPNPGVNPTVSPTGGTGAAVTRYYVYTFVSDWNEESGPSPVSDLQTAKVDSTWAISGMDTAPPNSGTVTGATYSGGFVTVTLGARHYGRTSDQITFASVGGMTDLNGTFTIADVPAYNQVKVALTTAQTYTSGGTWSRPVPWGTCTKRLYRTSGSTADFQLVAEGISGTTYSDTLLDTAIPGDSLVSAAWAPPPVNLTGLVALPDGSIAGYIAGGSTVCRSEPYQPHAWPAEYQRQMQFPVSGIAALADSSVVVATTGMPYIITGADPASALAQKIESALPCLSSHSVCSIGDAAIYSTRGGLARVGPGVIGGAELMTSGVWGAPEWVSLTPGSLRCAFSNGVLHMFSTTAPASVYMLPMTSADAGLVTSAPQTVDTLHAAPDTGRLYFAFGRQVYEFNPDSGEPLTYNWRSKDFVVPSPVNLGAAKVVFDAASVSAANTALAAAAAARAAANVALIAAGQARGSINASRINRFKLNGSALQNAVPGTASVTFQLYAGGVLRFTKLLTSGKAFRLPAGYKADEFSMKLISNVQVRSVEMAETMLGLKQV